MKILTVGRGTVLELWSDHIWSNGHRLVLSNSDWDAIEIWCRQHKIYYSRSGNMISFFNEKDVTMFMLRWS